VSKTDKYLKAIDHIECEYSGDLSAMFTAVIEVARNDNALSLTEFNRVYDAYVAAQNQNEEKAAHSADTP